MRLADSVVQRLKLILAPPIWSVLATTVRIPRTARPPGPISPPVIFACLHRDFIPAILFVKPARPALLVSHSPDGDILIRALTRGGYRFVRGSTGHDGGRGFVGLLRELKRGHNVGVAVDGPKGPFGTVHDGVIQLSRRAGCPILPLAVRCRHRRVLRTWDRTVVPWPGSRVLVAEGEPLQVKPEASADEIGRLRARLLASLQVLQRPGAPSVNSLAVDNPDRSEPCLP